MAFGGTRTKAATDAYRSGWELAYGKKKGKRKGATRRKKATTSRKRGKA